MNFTRLFRFAVCVIGLLASGCASVGPASEYSGPYAGYYFGPFGSSYGSPDVYYNDPPGFGPPGMYDYNSKPDAGIPSPKLPE